MKCRFTMTGFKAFEQGDKMSKKPVLPLTNFDKLPFTKRGPKLTGKDHRDRRELSKRKKKGD